MQITAKGQSGTIEFDGTTITIRRDRVLSRMTIGKGEKRIPVALITAVQWKPPGALVNGYISFTLAGGVERQSSFGRQTADAIRDENSVIVTKKQAPPFEELRAAIDAAMTARHANPPTAQASGVDQIAQLVALHEAGHLTDAEFAAAKARALGL